MLFTFDGQSLSESLLGQWQITTHPCHVGEQTQQPALVGFQSISFNISLFCFQKPALAFKYRRFHRPDEWHQFLISYNIERLFDTTLSFSVAIEHCQCASAPQVYISIAWASLQIMPCQEFDNRVLILIVRIENCLAALLLFGRHTLIYAKTRPQTGAGL